jgi:hypothetical protein
MHAYTNTILIDSIVNHVSLFILSQIFIETKTLLGHRKDLSIYHMSNLKIFKYYKQSWPNFYFRKTSLVSELNETIQEQWDRGREFIYWTATLGRGW